MRRSIPLTSLLFLTIAASAQTTPPKHATTAPAAAPSGSAEHAVALVETGHCSEALPILSRSVAHITDKDLQKRAALDGLRCATLLRQHAAILEMLRVLDEHFPHDPEVLYVTLHAYSDLSSEAAATLAQTAPGSIPALEMDAETNELQGKWDEAEKDYRKILEKDPRYPGIHFRLARLLLSRPNPQPDFQDAAKKELNQELQIDPTNAGAEYVLGELAREGEDFDTAIRHFKKATELNSNFADAYLGLGMSLLSEKNYTEAVPPLESAVKFQPGNPAAHYGLATAYARTGRKEAAEREFALQQQTAQRTSAPGSQPPGSQPPQ